MITAAVVILSGGIDSTVLLHSMVKEGREVAALSFHYGQRHSRELVAAKYQAEEANVPHEIVDLAGYGRLVRGNALTGVVEVPDGPYSPERMPDTVVPNRNMVMLSIAAGWAMSLAYGVVAYGAHHNDSATYLDCRPAFIGQLGVAIGLAFSPTVVLTAPFLHMTKAEIVKHGHDLGVDLRATWSCYKGGSLHCGKCATCLERREAFKLAGVPDPTEWAT